MARPKRSKVQREKDLATIAQAYLQGDTQADIAARIGVSQPQIAYDLKTLQERWRTASMIDFGERKATELARIDVLERQYWESWKKSLDERQVSNTEKVIKDGSRASEN